ncbi:hypothetical protein PENTCL1PPCAC_18740, partial [Pristionchus entomophagus]
GKIRVSLDAKAHPGKRKSHYDRPYPIRTKEIIETQNSQAQGAENASAVAAAEPQKQAAAAADAAPATAGPPVLLIVLCVVGAIILSLVLAGAGFAWVKRENRKANKLKTERTQETETLIANPETDKPSAAVSSKKE